jgi:hypothetical protein
VQTFGKPLLKTNSFPVAYAPKCESRASAAIKLVDTGTGIAKSTASGSDGGFVFVDLQAATYKLTAAAQGFQTAVLDKVTVDTGRTTDVAVQLTVGAATQTVEASSSGAQLETTSNEVGTTINNNAIQNLPYSSRDVLMFSLLVAGNTTANDATGRNSTLNGLPNASLNISIDGMNNNSQRFKSGGTSMYTFAPERIDAIEQVTVSTTGMGAESSAEGDEYPLHNEAWNGPLSRDDRRAVRE